MLKRNFMASLNAWRTNPARMFARAAVSAFIGQGIFWKFGYDQLGVGMDPKVQIGFGVRLANWLAGRLPNTATVAWSLKAVEIATDLGKMPLEGRALTK